jgi:hypothetical protein
VLGDLRPQRLAAGQAFGLCHGPLLARSLDAV